VHEKTQTKYNSENAILLTAASLQITQN